MLQLETSRLELEGDYFFKCSSEFAELMYRMKISIQSEQKCFTMRRENIDV